MDVSLSEDAHFMARLSWPTENSDYVTYVGVADGVGSWRGIGEQSAGTTRQPVVLRHVRRKPSFEL